MTTVATTSLSGLVPVDLRVLVKGVSLLERCHLHLAADVPRRAEARCRERHRDAGCGAGHPDAQERCPLAIRGHRSLGGLHQERRWRPGAHRDWPRRRLVSHDSGVLHPDGQGV